MLRKKSLVFFFFLLKIGGQVSLDHRQELAHQARSRTLSCFFFFFPHRRALCDGQGRSCNSAASWCPARSTCSGNRRGSLYCRRFVPVGGRADGTMTAKKVCVCYSPSLPCQFAKKGRDQLALLCLSCSLDPSVTSLLEQQLIVVYFKRASAQSGSS